MHTTSESTLKLPRNPLWNSHISAVFFSLILNAVLFFILLSFRPNDESRQREEMKVITMTDQDLEKIEVIEELVEPPEIEPIEDIDMGDIISEAFSSRMDSLESNLQSSEPIVDIPSSPVVIKNLSEHMKGIQFESVLDGDKKVTRFMGDSAKGNRFAFVIDYSQSMSPEQLAVMKSELYNAIEAVGEQGMVTLLFFSGPVWRPDQDAQEAHNRWEGDQKIGWKLKADAEPPQPRWLIPDKDNLAALERMIYQTPTTYGTDWYHPFKMILDMDPKPDMVFFMTDGANPKESSEKTLAYIKQLPPFEVRINTVALGVNISKVAPLQTIAQMTHGKFRHYDSKELAQVLAKLPPAPEKFSKKNLKYLEDADVQRRVVKTQTSERVVEEEKMDVVFQID